jgi:hypothetical protein
MCLGTLADGKTTMNQFFTHHFQKFLTGILHPVYSGSDIPSAWVETVKRAFEGLSTSVTSNSSSVAQGWLSKLAPLLLILVAAGLRYLYRNAGSKGEKWSFHLLLAGLLITAGGMAMRTRVYEAGFPVAVIGMLFLTISASIYFVAKNQP